MFLQQILFRLNLNNLQTSLFLYFGSIFKQNLWIDYFCESQISEKEGEGGTSVCIISPINKVHLYLHFLNKELIFSLNKNKNILLFPVDDCTVKTGFILQHWNSIRKKKRWGGNIFILYWWPPPSHATKITIRHTHTFLAKMLRPIKKFLNSFCVMKLNHLFE